MVKAYLFAYLILSVTDGFLLVGFVSPSSNCSNLETFSALIWEVTGTLPKT